MGLFFFMKEIYTYFIIGAAVLLFMAQFYFRWKVMKGMQNLSRKNIGFGLPQIINKKRLYSDVIVHHPKSEREILATVDHIRFALIFTSGMILLMIIAFVLLSIL